MKKNDWIVSQDTGISSKTIWAVMMGANIPEGAADMPRDPADFGRCYRLLKGIPEWRNGLWRVEKKYPEWGPMIREWGTLEWLYERDLPTGHSTDLARRMDRLYAEGCKLRRGVNAENNSAR